MASNGRRGTSRGQSVGEYTVLVAVVILAIASMLVYAQRGLQGRYKNAVDAAQTAAGSSQYEPVAVTESLNQQFSQNVQQQVSPGGKVKNDGTTTVTTGYAQDIPVQ